MRPAHDLEALRLTLESWREERVILEEQNGGVSVELLGPEGPGTRPIKPYILKYWFPRPTTIEQVLPWAMQAGIIEDSPEDRKDFFWMYKHYETSSSRVLDLECL